MRENGVLVVPNGLDVASLTVSTSVVPLPAREHPSHMYRRAVIQTDATIRWTASETPPADDFGLLLEAGQTLVFDGALDTLRFIRDASASSDASVTIHYFGL